MDIIILQLPNKTIEIPPLGSSILIGALKNKGFTAKQIDLNVELKNQLLKSDNLNYIYNRILPFALKTDMTEKYYKNLSVLYQTLNFINTEYSFKKMEMVKELLQERKYIDVFNNKENTLIFENIIKVLSLSSSFFELIITNEIFEINFPDFYFFLHIDNTLNDICTQMPTIIGFSVVQLQRKLSLWTCERLRKKFNYQGNIVFGGSDITYYKEKYLIEFPFIDYAIYQEGEYALPQLLDFLKGNTDIKNVPNLIFRNHNQICINEPITPCDFDQIIPDFSDLKLNIYLTHSIPMQISRGCSWGKCTYCKHYKTYGEKYYHGDLNNTISVIKTLINKYNTNLFHFVDDDFPRILKNEFCKKIIEKNIDIKWLTYSRLDENISFSDLELWYNAGLRVIEWGLESASQKVLDSVNKGINITNIKSLLYNSNKIGILNKLFMFHNLPVESYDDLYLSLQFLKKFVENGFVRAFWEISTPLELLDGTVLYEQSKNQNIFAKTFRPRGHLEAKAGYVHKYNYKIKEDIFNYELEDAEIYYKSQGILNVNDEAIMFDVIIEELSHNHNLYAKVR